MSEVGAQKFSGASVDLDVFLAGDFSRIGAALIKRCMKLEGRLYISGATGFFGKNLLSLLAFLQRQGGAFEVTALSRSPERFVSEQPWCRDWPWLKWQKGDVLDKWPGETTYDYLVHAAGETAAEAHLEKLSIFDKIVRASRNALEFAAVHQVKRILLCGSGAQYGSIPAGRAAGLSESSLLACDPTKPSSAYGEGKRASEMLAALHGDKHGFGVVSARCFAFIGPGLPLDGHYAIGNFLRDALEEKPIHLNSDGTALRSYLYGADLAVWLLVLLLEAATGTAVNVGSDRPVRLIDLAKSVRDFVNPRLPVQAEASPSSGERQFYVPAIDYAKSLGLDAWTDLQQAIARTTLWHRIRRPDMRKGPN